MCSSPRSSGGSLFCLLILVHKIWITICAGDKAVREDIITFAATKLPNADYLFYFSGRLVDSKTNTRSKSGPEVDDGG